MPCGERVSSWSDIGAVELNEAFAVQSLACIDAWRIDPKLVNAKGGAISIGHPLGASGGRILGTLAKRLAESGERWGVAAICIGVGQGLAVVLENVARRRTAVVTAVLCADPDEAVAGIADGSVVLIGGFGMAGMPVELIDALIRTDAGDLTVVSNNAGNGDTGLAALLAAGRVRKMVCSFPRQSDSWVFDRLYRAGEIELELVPQGNLAERMRAAGAGIGAFFTPTGAGTPLADGKETREINGRTHVLEYPIHGDVALIKAHRADRLGNLVYRKTARNFGPVMATAAATVDCPGQRGGRDRRAGPGKHCHPRHLRGQAGGGMSGAIMKTREQPSRGTTGLNKHQIAALVARDIPRGPYVNLGIGQPTIVADHLAEGSGVVLHTENGMLNMGRAAVGDEIDPDLTNAGKIPVTELPGASYFHQADSFAMMRGGHLDVCVLGAFQVSTGR